MLLCSLSPFLHFSVGVIRQFHHVVKIILRAANLQDVHQSFMRPGKRLEFLDAFELALERTAVFESGAIDDLDGAQRTEFVPSQPYFAVAAATDDPQQFVIGHRMRLRVEG